MNASQQVRDASARAFGGWCLPSRTGCAPTAGRHAEADQTALAVIALIEGALILSRIAGDGDALNAAKAAVRTDQPRERSSRRELMPRLP